MRVGKIERQTKRWKDKERLRKRYRKRVKE